jgi:pentapeptide MXKDX repeat protein
VSRRIISQPLPAPQCIRALQAGVSHERVIAQPWRETEWDEMRWDGMGWDGMGWDEMRCDAMGWDGMGWDGMACHPMKMASLKPGHEVTTMVPCMNEWMLQWYV